MLKKKYSIKNKKLKLYLLKTRELRIVNSKDHFTSYYNFTSANRANK